MIANTEFHTINSYNVCTVVPEELSGHVKADKTVSYIFCATCISYEIEKHTDKQDNTSKNK